MDKTKVITLCGSSRYIQEMALCAWLLEKHENVITMGMHLLPVWYDAPADHLAEAEGVAERMDALHKRKIDISSEIFVVNKNDYIGKSTTGEIEHAKAAGVDIRWYTHDPIGAEVDKIIKDYLDKHRGA